MPESESVGRSLGKSSRLIVGPRGRCRRHGRRRHGGRRVVVVVVGNGVADVLDGAGLPVLVSAVAYTTAPVAAKPTDANHRADGLRSRERRRQAHESSGPADGCWVPSQRRWSAQIDSGRITTSAASTAIATLSVTRMPKSRSSGGRNRSARRSRRSSPPRRSTTPGRCVPRRARPLPPDRARVVAPRGAARGSARRTPRTSRSRADR